MILSHPPSWVSVQFINKVELKVGLGDGITKSLWKKSMLVLLE